MEQKLVEAVRGDLFHALQGYGLRPWTMPMRSGIYVPIWENTQDDSCTVVISVHDNGDIILNHGGTVFIANICNPLWKDSIIKYLMKIKAWWKNQLGPKSGIPWPKVGEI